MWVLPFDGEIKMYISMLHMLEGLPKVLRTTLFNIGDRRKKQKRKKSRCFFGLLRYRFVTLLGPKSNFRDLCVFQLVHQNAVTI